MNRVLVVDDNDAIAFAFEKLCAASGVRAETADSLESALLLLSHGHYDVLISDLNLNGDSGLEGLEIVRAAKAYNPSIRTYIWTAYDEPLARDKAEKTGIEGYLIKPVKFETLLSIMEDVSTAVI